MLLEVGIIHIFYLSMKKILCLDILFFLSSELYECCINFQPFNKKYTQFNGFVRGSVHPDPPLVKVTLDWNLAHKILNTVLLMNIYDREKMSLLLTLFTLNGLTSVNSFPKH